MYKFSEFCHKVYQNVFFIILTILNAGAILLHNKLIENLDRPAGVSEALKFYFSHLSEYFGAMLVGLLAFAISILLIIVCSISIFNIATDNYDEDDDIYRSKKSKIIEVIIKGIISISLVVVDSIFAGYTFLLLFTLVIIVAIVGVIIWALNNK